MARDDDDDGDVLDPVQLAGQLQAHQTILAYMMTELAARFDDPKGFLHDFKDKALPEADPDDPLAEYAAQEMEEIVDLAERSFE